MRSRYLFLASALCTAYSLGYCQSNEYLSLGNGNYWTFSTFDVRGTDTLSTDYRFTLSVITDTTIDAIAYGRIVQQWNGLSIPDTIIARKDRLGHRIIWRIGGIEQIVYRFSEPVGTSWNVNLPVYPDTSLAPYKVTVIQNGLNGIPFSTPEKVIMFKFFGLRTSELEWDECYAMNIGPILLRRYPTEVETWDIAVIDEAYVDGRLVVVDSAPTGILTESLGAIKLQVGTQQGEHDEY